MHQTIRILIADDMPAVRSIVRNMLEEMGFTRISEAEDGDMAWEEIKNSAQNPGDAIGLVVADWNMPGISGVDLLRTVRSFAPTRNLPFLIVTAKGSHESIAEATRAGVTDYIVKPFSAEQLGEKINAALSLHR